MRADDGGQLMLLAGIVITLSFILTALTLAQVGTLERAAAAHKPSTLDAQWRFLHERLASNLEVGVTDQMSNHTFSSDTFPAIVSTFRTIQAEKGYDTVIRIANGTQYPSQESHLHDGVTYDAWSGDGAVHFDHAWDGVDNGVIWEAPCPAAGGPPTGCIVGVYVYVRLSDASGSVEETILYAVNQG